ncbi:MAG: hypothetical protein M3T56_14370 [Chloroflexota bacterium]|nr:hypothetical protein [Chloroflexota bacterium]
MVRRAIIVAVLFVVSDRWLPNDGPWPAIGGYIALHFPQPQRIDFVSRLLMALVPTTLVVALAALALPALSPYANPGLLLLRDRHVGALRRVVIGPGNPFRRALQLALVVTASAAALALSTLLDLSPVHWPAVTALGLLAFLEVVLLLNFVVWVLELRQPAGVAEYIADLHGNAIGSIRRSAYQPSISGERQAELREFADALAQVALRTLSENQPFATRDALASLGRLRTQADPLPRIRRGRTRKHQRRFLSHLRTRAIARAGLHGKVVRRLRRRILAMQAAAKARRLMVDRELVIAYRSVLLAASENHSVQVAEDVTSSLMGMADAVIGQVPARQLRPIDLAGTELVGEIIRVHAEAVVRCLTANDQLVRDRLLENLQTLLGRLAFRAERAVDEGGSGDQILHEAVGEGLVRILGVAAVSANDLGATRSLIVLLNEVTSEPRLTAIAVDEVVALSTLGLSVGAYAATRLLLEWATAGARADLGGVREVLERFAGVPWPISSAAEALEFVKQDTAWTTRYGAEDVRIGRAIYVLRLMKLGQVWTQADARGLASLLAGAEVGTLADHWVGLTWSSNTDADRTWVVETLKSLLAVGEHGPDAASA